MILRGGVVTLFDLRIAVITVVIRIVAVGVLAQLRAALVTDVILRGGVVTLFDLRTADVTVMVGIATVGMTLGGYLSILICMAAVTGMGCIALFCTCGICYH